mmetsp:Transcript_33228/g.53255  ORF Transcript_33228/g.53255 Transcript_33228/m.53255 type:complete len:134 (+) Transcript_33228:134-535(+)|eukprot:CAMPEP_0197031764 /NCGR_PEP_ID=MMETSP1384-20130603/10659_1 /TAXON_ID=29189 /ORGANISM="Ammonia sp." /LENGTH=133 /DNA_ID=CAMNT_0042461335 /DNA_START=174 /DNA_END=575 /DNA_ORIENTATION=-
MSDDDGSSVNHNNGRARRRNTYANSRADLRKEKVSLNQIKKSLNASSQSMEFQVKIRDDEIKELKREKSIAEATIIALRTDLDSVRQELQAKLRELQQVEQDQAFVAAVKNAIQQSPAIRDFVLSAVSNAQPE